MDFEAAEETTSIESVFVRRRNILMLRGRLSPVYTDYYLHLMQHGLRNPDSLDETLKDLMAMLTLHLVARPWAENIAWTVNMRAPRVNIFATGASISEQVTGRCFTENVREPDRNLFYSQTTLPNREPRLSTIEIDRMDALEWIEELYRSSEQRPCRAFRLPDDCYVLLAAQPDFDAGWLESVTAAEVARIEQREEIKLLETRRFRFRCGCTLDRILPALGAWRDQPEKLFQGEESITIQCPRCAAKFSVTQDMI